MLYLHRFIPILILASLFVSACQPIIVDNTVSDVEVFMVPDDGAIAQINDIQMYYEIHGEGEPLLLMPSGMWSTADFAGLTELLAEEYQVVVMDARGRGRSTDSGQRLDFEVMADDAVALMDELAIENAHIVGWADSAVVGLEMAMRYPERVDKLVTYAPNYTVEGLTEEHREWLKSLHMDDMSAMFGEKYALIAPDPGHLPLIVERVRALYLTEPTYMLEQLSEITAPTLVFCQISYDTGWSSESVSKTG